MRPEDSFRPHLSTRIRIKLNTVLSGVGLEMGTTRARDAEVARIHRLETTGHWEHAPYSGGLDLQPEGYLRFLQQHDISQISGIETSSDYAPTASGYYFHNGWYEGWDAMVLYGLLQSLRPQTVVECGSGFSTRLMRQAILDGDLETRLTSIDPEPRVDVIGQADVSIPERVEEATSTNIASSLLANDILFVDSSHAVATGGDVTYLCLEILPQLRPGVFVHFHDVFIPYEYPKMVVIDQRWGWTEQYLLHAFMAYNDSFEIVWPSFYMGRVGTREVTALLGPDTTDRPSSGLWLRRIR